MLSMKKKETCLMWKVMWSVQNTACCMSCCERTKKVAHSTRQVYIINWQLTVPTEGNVFQNSIHGIVHLSWKIQNMNVRAAFGEIELNGKRVKVGVSVTKTKLRNL